VAWLSFAVGWSAGTVPVGWPVGDLGPIGGLGSSIGMVEDGAAVDPGDLPALVVELGVVVAAAEAGGVDGEPSAEPVGDGEVHDLAPAGGDVAAVGDAAAAVADEHAAVDALGDVADLFGGLDGDAAVVAEQLGDGGVVDDAQGVAGGREQTFEENTISRNSNDPSPGLWRAHPGCRWVRVVPQEGVPLTNPRSRASARAGR
jgi:hypothetical protein